MGMLWDESVIWVGPIRVATGHRSQLLEKKNSFVGSNGTWKKGGWGLLLPSRELVKEANAWGQGEEKLRDERNQAPHTHI